MSNSPLQPRYEIGVTDLRVQSGNLALNLADHGWVPAGKVITSLNLAARISADSMGRKRATRYFAKVSPPGSA